MNPATIPTFVAESALLQNKFTYGSHNFRQFCGSVYKLNDDDFIIIDFCLSQSVLFLLDLMET